MFASKKLNGHKIFQQTHCLKSQIILEVIVNLFATIFLNIKIPRYSYWSKYSKSLISYFIMLLCLCLIIGCYLSIFYLEKLISNIQNQNTQAIINSKNEVSAEYLFDHILKN